MAPSGAKGEVYRPKPFKVSFWKRATLLNLAPVLGPDFLDFSELYTTQCILNGSLLLSTVQ
jgi:hypothetical protein